MKDQISSVSHKAVIGGKKPSLRNVLMGRAMRKSKTMHGVPKMPRLPKLEKIF